MKNIKFRGNKTLSQSLDNAVRHVYKKRGFAQTRIISDWKSIVGKQFALYSHPRKVYFSTNNANGTLYVEVYDSSVAMQLSYMEQQILEKISMYLGSNSINKIKIFQNPIDIDLLIKKEIKPYSEPKLSKEQHSKIDNCLLGLEDDFLKQQLSILGSNILSNKN